MCANDYIWYVYKLIDPRSSKVFYVGKGKGNRALNHKSDVLSGKYSNEAKSSVIRSILRSGYDVRVEYDSYFICEKTALMREAELINEIKGLSNIIKNKFKPVVISLQETISDFLCSKIPSSLVLSRLRSFKAIASHPDHIVLIDCFSNLAEKAVSNQLVEDKVYGQ